MKILISVSNPIHFSYRSYVAFALGIILSIIARIILLAFPLPARAAEGPLPVQRTISPLSLMEEKINEKNTPAGHSFSLSEKNIMMDNLPASAYVLINLDTREILAHKSLHKTLPVASLTKLMTAVVALDLSSPEEEFAVSEHAARQIPTKIGVKAGMTLSLDELLQALLLTSANDAAEVIKEGIDARYGGQVFTEAMNRKARFLGLTNTHFDNPQGFDSPGNYSTAYDLALLTSIIAENYPYIMDLVGKDQITIPRTSTHGRFDLLNWNGLIGVYPEVMGMKIGNTESAGKTTIVLSRRKNIRLLAVVLGTTTVVSRDLTAAGLLDAGYEKLEGAEPVNITEKLLLKKYDTWRS